MTSLSGQNKSFLDRLFRYPWLIVLAIGIATVFFAFQLPRAELDNDNMRFIPENDEARLNSRYIDDTFKSSSFILIALERKYGDIFDAAFLNRIREFNARMGDFEIVGDVNSIVSSDYIYADGDSIVVHKLLDDDFSGTPGEINVLKQKLLSWDIYRHALISDDFKATQIMVPLEISSDMMSRPEVIDSFIEIRDIAKEMFKGYADVYVTGIPVISATINEAMKEDLKTMIPLVFLVVLVVLFFSLRHLTYVVLPLITVLVAVVWSVGSMPLLGIKLSVVSTVLPVILVAVGSAYGIHMVTHYRGDSRGKTGMSREEHKTFVLSVIRKIGKAVFLAALTTLAGFSSFCFTTVVPIRDFGFFSTFGVLIAFMTALTLIPALLIIRGPKAEKAVKGSPQETSGTIDLVVARFFAGIAKRKGAVIFTVAIVVLFSMWGLSKLVIDNIFVEYFKSTTDISRSDRFIREKFGGSKIVSVVVSADDSETLLMPEVLGAMDDLETYLAEQVPEVGKVLGFTDMIKRINQVFNADEDPKGIRPAGTSASNEGGSGDFGFASFAEGASGNTGAESTTGSVADSKEKKTEKINTADVVALLQKASSSGRDRAMDVNGLVWEMEKLINYGGAAYYEIPRDPARYGKTNPHELSQLVGNYLVLLSGNIGSYANDPLQPTAIKTTVQLRTIGNKDTDRAITSIRKFIADRFPSNVKTIVGGSALVEESLNRLVVQSQIISVFVSVFIVFFIITISYRSFVAGLIGIAPLSVCMLINFAVMGALGIKLNIGTSMMASLCVGIGIDYTIHYIEAYKREYYADKGKGDFLLKTFTSSGKAILINAISVGFGFAVLILSQFIMLKDLGLLVAFTMLSSALVSLTVIPVLLSILKPKFIRNGLV